MKLGEGPDTESGSFWPRTFGTIHSGSDFIIKFKAGKICEEYMKTKWHPPNNNHKAGVTLFDFNMLDQRQYENKMAPIVNNNPSR